MFDAIAVVQSAVSSFNNAALAGANFFWSAVLCLPLFALVWVFASQIKEKFNPKNLPLAVEGLLVAWLILVHGNYAVLRNESILPVAIAACLFVLAASMVQNLRTINPALPLWWIRQKRHVKIAAVSALLVVISWFSSAPAWAEFMLQTAAILCGWIAGRYSKFNINLVLPLFVITNLIIMQPEFFRFGQLGHLTIIHLLFAVAAGATAMAVLALRNVRPCGKIRENIFRKLKWLFRAAALLCIVLFFFTESVPIFLALCTVLFAMFAMSIWHMKTVDEVFAEKMFAVLLMIFGIIIALPVVAALGVFYWRTLPKKSIKTLLATRSLGEGLL